MHDIELSPRADHLYKLLHRWWRGDYPRRWSGRDLHRRLRGGERWSRRELHQRLRGGQRYRRVADLADPLAELVAAGHLQLCSREGRNWRHGPEYAFVDPWQRIKQLYRSPVVR